MNRYQHWLTVVCSIYGIPEVDIQRGSTAKATTAARLLLYGLCIRDNLCLKYIATSTGKHRSNIRKFLDYQWQNKSVPPQLINRVYNLYNDKI